jgi:CrcB protein
MIWIAVAAGGALGSLARHGVNVLVAGRVGRSLPYGTAFVNIVGCVLIGLLAGLVASDRWPMTDAVRAFLFVGVLGGFTTFSSLGLDTFALLREGAYPTAFWNVAGQVGLGLAAVVGGFRLGSFPAR